MRAMTAKQLHAIDNPYRASHLKVEVDSTGSADWLNLSSLDGRDWVTGATFTRGVDSAVQGATIKIAREHHGLSLATFIAASKYNQAAAAIDIARDIRVFMAVVGEDEAPEDEDWELRFSGIIDDVDNGGREITLKCSDDGGRLVTRFIKTQEVYGSPSGTDLEDVIQDILDDHASGTTLYSENGTGGTPFNPSDSPGWKLLEFKGSKDHVLPAIRKLAQQIGWDVKYKWHENTSQYQLVLSAPDRPDAARGSLTLTGLPVAAETFVFNLTTFTAVASGPGANEFEIGATAQETVTNIVRAFLASGETANGNVWQNGTKAVFEWGTFGPDGNSITFTESLTNATMDGGGTLGGTQAGTDGKTTPDHTFSPQQYQDTSKFSISRMRIRNKIRVTYGDTELGERVTVEVNDTDSQAKYEEGYMEVTERSGSQIDTGSEATRFAQSMLSDLSEPEATLGVPVMLQPFLEIGDLIRFEANETYFDSDQDLAIVGIVDEWRGPRRSTTRLSCRGKPSGGVDRWLSLQGMPGIAAPVDLFEDSAAENVGTEAGIGAITVFHDDPKTMSPPIDDWAYTVAHVNLSSGFTPGLATEVARGRQTRFTIGGLVPGTTYYAKLVIVDEQGNESVTSTQVIKAAEMSGAYHENPERNRANLIANGDFGQATLDITANPVDGWELYHRTGGTLPDWGSSDEVYFDATNQRTGSRSIKISSTDGFEGLLGQVLPVSPDTLYKLQFVPRGLVASDAIRVGFQFLDKDKAVRTTADFFSASIGSTGGWLQKGLFEYFGNFNAADRFLRPFFTGGAGDVIWLDQIVLIGAKQAFFAYRSSAQSVNSSAWTKVLFNTTLFDNGGDYDFTTNRRYDVAQDGKYSFKSRVSIDSLPDQDTFLIAYYVNGVRTERGNSIHQSGAGALGIVVTAEIDLVVGDYVEVFVWQNSGGALNLRIGREETYFGGSRDE
jgi:hypothetical protein